MPGTMARSLLLALAGAALATAAGCSTSNNIPLEAMPGELGKVFCEKIYGCCSAAERMDNPLIGKDQKSCETFTSGLLTLGFGGLQDSVAKGRAAYHADQMAACLQKLRGLSCAEARMGDVALDRNLPECAMAIEAKVAVGGACLDSADCIAGYCTGATDTEKLGVCMATKVDGQPCQDDEQCMNGACTNAACARKTSAPDNLCK